MSLRSLQLDIASAKLRAGGVIAYPTEGVWGLGCDPFNRSAVFRLLALKGRSVGKGLILVAGSVAQAAPLLSRLSAMESETVLSTWPGPVTWIVPAPAGIPVWIRGLHDGLAVRVSAHPLVAGLCTAFGGPVVSTSANPEGRSPARSAVKVRGYFGQAIDYLLPGNLGGAPGATEIRDARSLRVMRAARPARSNESRP